MRRRGLDILYFERLKSSDKFDFIHSGHSFCLIQHQEDLINTQDNLPLIEEATEREPCGSRIIRILIIN
jgi:hypothetical protein